MSAEADRTTGAEPPTPPGPPAPRTPRPRQNPGLKLVLELGPLVAFFITNWKFGIFPATAVLMVCVIVTLAISWVMTRHLPIMPVVTAVAVVFFGAVLLGGLAMGKPLLPVVLDSVLRLDEEGWRKLTLRWGVFFFVLAALNEIVWRTQTTDFWVSFKAFGVMPITIAFALLQTPLLLRHEVKDDEQTPEHW